MVRMRGEVRDATNKERHGCARRRDGEPAVSLKGSLAAPSLPSPPFVSRDDFLSSC